MSFCVVRHPEAGVGTVPDGALPTLRVNGWVRVSDFRAQPNDFHLPDFTNAPDLDAPEPEPEPKTAPAKTTKESKV